MKIQSLLKENIHGILDIIHDTCETDKANCARYLSTIMLMKDMGKRLREEGDELQKNTYIDYMYGTPEVAKRALGLFYERIQENPRARNLFKKYETQFLDDAYGHVVMRNRIDQLRPYFNQRMIDRVKYHEDRLVDNLSRAQDKLAKDYIEGDDLQDGASILDNQASGRQDNR